jgi:hypothetical protein
MIVWDAISSEDFLSFQITTVSGTEKYLLFSCLCKYTITILHLLLIPTSRKHSLLQTFETPLALQSIDTLSDIK